MEKKTLSIIMQEKIFQIPDYQRGYAWEEKQWKDFVLDIDELLNRRDKLQNMMIGPQKIARKEEKNL